MAVCVCRGGGCSYPPNLAARAWGVQQGPSLCGGGFVLLAVRPSTFFSCSGIASSPRNLFGFVVCCPCKARRGGVAGVARSWDPPPSSLELGVAESIAAAGGGRSFAASQPRRGWCPSGKAVKGWMLVSPPAGGALPGSHKASGTYGCHTARRSTGSRCCSNAGAGPPPFPLTRFPRG